MDTAETIGYSCGIISEDSEVYKIRANKDVEAVIQEMENIKKKISEADKELEQITEKHNQKLERIRTKQLLKKQNINTENLNNINNNINTNNNSNNTNTNIQLINGVNNNILNNAVIGYKSLNNADSSLHQYGLDNVNVNQSQNPNSQINNNITVFNIASQNNNRNSL